MTDEAWIDHSSPGNSPCYRGAAKPLSKGDWKHYMRVKPCPDCDGDGAYYLGNSAVDQTCKNCKDGWVIA